MSEWISIKEKLPKINDFIFYSSGNEARCSFGRYCGIEDPMPSAEKGLQWQLVKYWMPIPKFPNYQEKKVGVL